MPMEFVAIMCGLIGFGMGLWAGRRRIFNRDLH